MYVLLVDFVRTVQGIFTGAKRWLSLAVALMVLALLFTESRRLLPTLPLSECHSFLHKNVYFTSTRSAVTASHENSNETRAEANQARMSNYNLASSPIGCVVPLEVLISTLHSLHSDECFEAGLRRA